MGGMRGMRGDGWDGRGWDRGLEGSIKGPCIGLSPARVMAGQLEGVGGGGAAFCQRLRLGLNPAGLGTIPRMGR